MSPYEVIAPVSTVAHITLLQYIYINIHYELYYFFRQIVYEMIFSYPNKFI